MSVGPQRDVVTVDRVTVVLADSVTQTQAGDAGCIVVSGSHGGTSSAGFAVRVPAALYVFNDAGIGKDAAGIAGLDVLQAAGIAGIAVRHDSARIGDARDTLDNGIVSAVNPLASGAGIEAGMSMRDVLGLFPRAAG